MISKELLTSRNYRMIQQMKPGGNGVVCVIEHVISKEVRVLKISFVDKHEQKEFEDQLDIWRKLCLKEEHIVGLKEHFYEDLNAYVIMEYCENGDLETLIKKKVSEKQKFTEYEIAKIIRDILQGLMAMHKLKVMHRDVKPSNVLIVKEGMCKLADFNLLRILKEENEKASTLTGTIQYMAPEVFGSQGYGFSADLYSVGAIAYELMTLTPAFPSRDIQHILTNTYTPIDASLGYADEMINLVYTLVSLNPAERPTAVAVLKHPWLTSTLVQGKMGDLLCMVEKQQEQQLQQQKTITKLQKTVEKQQQELQQQQETIAELQQQQQKQLQMIVDLKKSVATQPQQMIVVCEGEIEQLPSFKRTSKKGFYLSKSPEGIRCLSTSDDARTIFLETESITKGVVRWTVEFLCANAEFGNCNFCLGASMSDQTEDRSLRVISNSFSLHFWSRGVAELTGVKDFPGYFTSFGYDDKVSVNSLVSLELDANAHTIRYFVNDTQMSYGIAEIPIPLYFGVSFVNMVKNKASFVSKSFQRLDSPTPSRVVCKMYKAIVK